MRPLAALLCRIGRDQRGAMAIETAILAPVLITLAIGGFEVSQVVARQTELQSAAAEAAAIVRAALPETEEERTDIRDVLLDSTGLAQGNVSVAAVFRCGDDDDYDDAESDCEEGDFISRYIQITLSDSYQPVWTEFGLGSALSFSVTRTIQVG